MPDAWVLAVVPGFITGGLLAILGRLLTAPDRRRAAVDKARADLDEAREDRIAMLITERDEARAAEQRWKEQAAGMEKLLERYRPVRKGPQ